MKSFFHFIADRNKPKRGCTYDPELEKPVIRASICTGERTAGFKNRKTGAFREVMLIRNRKDLDEFMGLYDLEDIDTEY
jgi:hypothetical protein